MRERAALVAIAAAGVLLRLRGLLTEFWLDEIWSLRIAQEAKSIFAVFTLAHDNNHPLNTAYMLLVGNQPNWIVYRLPSFVCGMATVALLVMCAATARQRIAAALLGAVSLPMVDLGTEARGYAIAQVLVVFAFALRKKPWLSAVAAAVAMLAHLTAIYVWIALLLRDVVRRDRPLAPHALPAATAALLYFGFVRSMTFGGGPSSSKIKAAADAAAMSVGGHGTAAALIALALIAFGLVKEQERMFFAAAIVVVPTAVILLHRGEFVDARYFFVSLPFVLLLFARLADRLPRGVVVALLACWTVATALQFMPFFRFGRGTYREALAFIGSGDVSADNDFRTSTMIDFYAPGKIRYHGEEDPAYARTPWFLIQSEAIRPDPRRVINIIGGTYRLAGVFPYGGVSGWTWLVYRRVDAPAAPPAAAQAQTVPRS